MIGFVYMWINTITNKKYIGVHVGTEDDGYIGSGVHFKRAVSKYGLENFYRIILYREYNDKESLFKKEFDIINEQNAVFDEKYYNLTNYSPKQPFETDEKRIKIFTEEAKKKLSKAQKGKKWVHKFIDKRKISKLVKTPETFLNDGWILGLGEQSEEHIKKLSEIRKTKTGDKNSFYGRKHSEESKQKMKENAPDQSGKNNHFYGKTHSEESKQKMRENISNQSGKNNHFYGKTHSEESKQKMSLKNKNKIFINNGEISKRVRKENLDLMLEKGWNLGRLTNPKYINRILITNEIETIKINPQDFEIYSEKGYRKGRKKK